jgi:hypothetical protein
MIANERQHKIAAAEVKRFEKAIEHAQADGPTADVDPRIHSAMVAGMNSQLEDLREQVGEYQALRAGKVRTRPALDPRASRRPDRGTHREALYAEAAGPEAGDSRAADPALWADALQRSQHRATGRSRRGAAAHHPKDDRVPHTFGCQEASKERASTRRSARYRSRATRSGRAMAGRSTGKAAASSAGKY